MSKEFKKLRCDEEQGAVWKPRRERRFLRDRSVYEPEHSFSRLSILAYEIVRSEFLSEDDLKIFGDLAFYKFLSFYYTKIL